MISRNEWTMYYDMLKCYINTNNNIAHHTVAYILMKTNTNTSNHKDIISKLNNLGLMHGGVVTIKGYEFVSYYEKIGRLLK